MTCKYPITSRSYKCCLGCSDRDYCEDAVTLNIAMLELQTQKNVIPSASEANKMTNNAIDSCTTQQLAELSKLIRDAIKDGEFSISEDGYLKPETRKKLEDLGYKVERGCGERWANGELINYNSGNIVLYNHDRQVIYHIPYKGVKWILPGKKSPSLAEQFKKA